MVTRKSITRSKINKASTKTRKIPKYKVVATYLAIFKTKADADKIIKQIKARSKYAQIKPIKKTSRGYNVIVQFTMITSNQKIRDKAANGAKAQGAKVSVTTMK